MKLSVVKDRPEDIMKGNLTKIWRGRRDNMEQTTILTTPDR